MGNRYEDGERAKPWPLSCEREDADMQAVMVNDFGGPDKLSLGQAERPTAQPGQVLVKLSVAGVNFLDVAQRKGATPLAVPYVAGVEGVGTIAEVGDGVMDLNVGQRVGWLAGGQGSFADYAAVEAAKAVPIPDRIDDETATAALMQGITAHYLATDTCPIQPGDTVLVHAAAGGVGQMLTQVAKIRGATVIGTVSTPEKADTARSMGADHVLSYEGFAKEAKKLTDGQGAAVVYDGVGASTFEESIEALRIRGTLAIIGNASGPTPAVEIPRLAKASLYVTRPTVVHHIRTPEELRQRAADIFSWIASGELAVNIGGRYPLNQICEVFEALESRQTQGKLLLKH